MTNSDASATDEARAELKALIREYMPGADGEPDSSTIADAILDAGYRKVAETETCSACQGTRGYWAERWHDCPACGGSGRVKTEGNR